MTNFSNNNYKAFTHTELVCCQCQSFSCNATFPCRHGRNLSQCCQMFQWQKILLPAVTNHLYT